MSEREREQRRDWKKRAAPTTVVVVDGDLRQALNDLLSGRRVGLLHLDGQGLQVGQRRLQSPPRDLRYYRYANTTQYKTIKYSPSSGVTDQIKSAHNR